MIIGCISDLHGYISDAPDCDLLLITGDILGHSTPYNYNLSQEISYMNFFARWVEKESKDKKILIVPGNHDFIFDLDFDLLPDIIKDITLINRGVVIDSYNIYGTPYQPRFYNWAFNKDDVPDSLGQIYSLIPDNTDILLTHCPPYGILDESHGANCGSHMLLERVNQVNPLIHCFGHIHEGYGYKKIRKSHFVNAAQMDSDYFFHQRPLLIEV